MIKEMKCMVKWEGKGEWRGPFEVKNVDSIVIDGAYLRNIPRSWAIGIDDGWTIHDGTRRPVDESKIVDVMFRNGDYASNQCVAVLYWGHDFSDEDIVAYRIAEKPKTILCTSEPLQDVYEIVYDNATGKTALYDRRAETPTVDDDVPLTLIMNRSVWWKNDIGEWVALDRFYELKPVFVLTDADHVDRDWFTGREHKRAEEFER